MLSDLFHALRHGFDQIGYWRQTYSPLSPWKREIERVVSQARQESARYHVEAGVDRRRAYQVARMVIPNRLGEHLVDVVPDAYQAFSPPSAATFHSGRRQYDPPAERLAKLRHHPQTLAYLLTPPALCRLGIGVSTPGKVAVVGHGEEVGTDEVVARLREQATGPVSDDALRAYADVVRRLSAGLPEEAEDDEEAEAA